MNKLPVVAAIPNYNMGESLSTLLPTVLDNGYDEVYVLDDNSRDDSEDVTRSVSTDIRFIRDGENRGAGANRNRVLQALSHEAIVHFIDADCRIDSDMTAERVSEALPNEPFGFVGGLALARNGLQTIWNYGPRQSLWSKLGAELQIEIEPLLESAPDKVQEIHRRHPRLLKDWPNPLKTPVRRQVFWVVEQNMVVDSRSFGAVGGFDENLREHEIQDLAIRMSKIGLKNYFDPGFVTTHNAVDVREYDRSKVMEKAELYIARKHGYLNWFFPDGHLEPRL